MERTKNAHSKSRIKTIDTLRTIIVYAVALISQSLNRHVLESGAWRRSIPIAVTIYSVCIASNQLYIVRYRIIYNFKRNGKVHFMTLLYQISCRLLAQNITIVPHLRRILEIIYFGIVEKYMIKKFDYSPSPRQDGDLPNLNSF